MNKNQSDYTDLWISCTITAKQWIKTKHIDHWDSLKKIDLSDDRVFKIERYQSKLFHQIVSMQVSYIVMQLNRLTPQQKKIVISDRVRLIDSFRNGNSSSVILAQLQRITTIKEKEVTKILLAYQDIIENIGVKQIDDLKPESPRFIAQLLYDYRKKILQLNEKKEEVLPTTKTTTTKVIFKKKETYSQKQIAIAYRVMDIQITKDNYKEILKKHSNTTSAKILQKRIYKLEELTKLNENKTVDTKHLKDLKQAKQLLKNMKKKEAMKSLDRIIQAFTASYKSHY